MAGIPSSLKATCKETLAQSDAFDTASALRQVFNVDKLKPYQGKIHFEGSRENRIESVIDVLWDARRYGESVFVLFLKELRDREVEGSDGQGYFDELIASVQQHISGGSSANTRGNAPVQPSSQQQQGQVNVSNQGSVEGVVTGINQGTINYYTNQNKDSE
jgi:hypothetical protein